MGGVLGQRVSRCRSLLAMLVVALAVLGLPATMAMAQGAGSSGASHSETPAAVASELAPLTSEERAALIGKMTDAQARDLLLYYLSETAPAAQAGAATNTAALSMQALQQKGTEIRQNLSAVLGKFGHVLPDYLGHMQEKLRIGVGSGGLLLVVGTIVGLSLAGAVLEFLYRLATRSMVARYEAAPIETVRQKLTRALGQLGHGLGAIAAFAVGYAAAFFVIWQGDVPRRDFVIVVLLAILITRVAEAVVRFVFLPKHPGWRIMPVDDEAAAHFVRGTRRQVALGIALLLFGTLGRMWGVDHDTWRLGALLSGILFTLSYCFFLWRYRRHAVRSVQNAIEDGSMPRWAEGAAGWAWYAFAVAYVLVAFLVGIYALLLNRSFDPLSAALGFFVLFVFNPYLTAVLKMLFKVDDHSVVEEEGPTPIYVTDHDDGEQVEVTETASAGASSAVVRDKRVLGRVISIAVLVVSIALFALTIGVDVFSSSREYPLAQYVLGVLMDIGLILLVGYVCWSFIAAWIDRKLASEKSASGHDDHGDEGPALSAGTRLQTILPIFRRAVQIMLAVIVVMVALSSMGVNIAPLIAGAGVFGLAVGFGAQTLVKDLISGMFFLMDDAFRIGEYIDAGGTAGAVEKFNARSIVLRSTLGAVYTIPYGDIGKVTNFSRDWVIMKLRFRVPYDTDIDKVRKIFKKIGQEMMDDPDLGPDFIQPFKSQGVVKMDDSAFIVSGKFMAKPNKQWGIRKAVYQKVQEAFRANGINFAPKRVIVDVPNFHDDDEDGEGHGHKSPTREEVARAAAGAAVASEDVPPEKGN
ncbi:mechanosensitive ion channel family protein [Amorphus sp. 3PC139-8]|uniref:mechanosensitive ion channel family protein n=1 Tax=Amorphus sp. 3PC139-8 TaxID=2735676 RepID=UPI00345DBA84